METGGAVVPRLRNMVNVVEVEVGETAARSVCPSASKSPVATDCPPPIGKKDVTGKSVTGFARMREGK
ncbi:hypothetical protein RBB80_09405 [Tunturiibacter gelidiferens]